MRKSLLRRVISNQNGEQAHVYKQNIVVPMERNGLGEVRLLYGFEISKQRGIIGRSM